MSLQQPDFESVLSRCIRKGAEHIVVIPYFLHEGVHMREDIPHMMREFARTHSGVRLVLGKGLGFDPLLADILHKRIEESRSMKDILSREPVASS
jgi:sirohydrochlorin ferrochelatase